MDQIKEQESLDEATELNLKDYSVKEIKQLQKMTEEIRDHWLKMLKEAPASLSEGLRMAIQLSIEQSENDLEKIQAELSSR
jgi:truncated hemoglobin YjbI